MRKSIIKTFDIIEAYQLRKYMRLLFHRDTGMYTGTIISAGPSDMSNKITIIVGDILRYPSDIVPFDEGTTMTLLLGEDESVSTLIPNLVNHAKNR